MRKIILTSVAAAAALALAACSSIGSSGSGSTGSASASAASCTNSAIQHDLYKKGDLTVATDQPGLSAVVREQPPGERQGL